MLVAGSSTLPIYVCYFVGKFWSILPDHFIKHKPLISEECVLTNCITPNKPSYFHNFHDSCAYLLKIDNMRDKVKSCRARVVLFFLWHLSTLMNENWKVLNFVGTSTHYMPMDIWNSVPYSMQLVFLSYVNTSVK